MYIYIMADILISAPRYHLSLGMSLVASSAPGSELRELRGALRTPQGCTTGSRGCLLGIASGIRILYQIICIYFNILYDII